MLKREVTFTVRSLSNGIHRLMDSSIAKDWRITPMQGRFIGFIRRHQSDVFQRDLEAEFCIRRSTASAILQTMERDGLIRREAVQQDARLKKLVLTPKALALLDYLMTHPDELLTRQRLLEVVWGFDDLIGTRAVDHRVAELRRALGEDPAEPRWIRTVPGSGYRFIGDVTDGR